METKNLFKLFLGAALAVLAVVFAPAGLLLADSVAVDLPDAGHLVGGETAGNGDGASTVTKGAEEEELLYLKDIDKRIVKIRPMSTPLDAITREAARKEASKSMEVKYYSVGTKPINSTLAAAVTASTASTTVITVANPSYFGVADTIRVVGVKGYKADGATADSKDLVLSVISIDGSKLTVYAVNGTMVADVNSNVGVPTIANGTTIIRMGKACAETDAQAAVFSTIPSPEIQYCQIFMAQVEQSTLDKMSAKEVDWNFTDLEEASIYDMKMGMEGTSLFGVAAIHQHPVKGERVWFTGGIWWMAGKDYPTLGTYDSTKKITTVTDDQMVDFEKYIFTGTGAGNKRKVMFCGSTFLATLMKMKSEQYKFLKENATVEKWSLRFKSFDSEFGEIYAIHDELFDLMGMSDQAYVLDPDFLTKKTFQSFSRSMLDLKKAGIRNSNAVVLQEISCVYLTNPQAHCRVKLATA